MESFVSGDGDDEGKVRSVVLKDGTKLEVDVVVLGIGVEPNSDFLQGSPIELSAGGYVSVNDRLETSVPDVFAAGDITSFPLFLNNGGGETDKVSIGHWQLAHAQGRNAALNVAGQKTVLRSVPFFWTVQFGKSIRYAGYAGSYDDIVYDGKVDEGNFVAYYCKGEKVVAVATLMRDPVAAEFANDLLAGKELNKSDIGQRHKF